MDALLNDDNETLRLVSNTTREEALRPRSESAVSDRTLLNMSDSENDEKRRSGDLEKEGLIEQLPNIVTKEHVSKDPYARAKILMWMFVNTLATVTIVSYHCYPSTQQCRIRHSALNRCARIASTPNQMLTPPLFTRFSAIKPFSATNPSHNVKQPLQPSTSSSQQRPSTSSLVPQSACSSLERFPS